METALLNPEPAPARAGLFVYAKDVERLAAFYAQLLGAARVHAAADKVILRSPDLTLVVHAMPEPYATQVEIQSRPARRDHAAYKFFFTTASLDRAAELAASLGGEVLPERWRGPGIVVGNAVDPEGNIFQIREAAD